jgi:uncharacterized protein YdeI (YjbR/CyaY-like superfamily)
MVTRDPRVDAYIEKSAPFARPILVHLREVVHAACPEVVETIKWGMPSFEHKGLLCGMAAFKQHATFGFWKHAQVVEGDRKALDAMGSFGKLTSVADLPPKRALAGYVKKAKKLNDDGVPAVREKRAPRKALPMPPEFTAALAKNKRARATFEGFPPGKRREYVDWIAEAKGADTRQRRLAQAIEWLAEGKARNWKYEKC